MRRLGGSLAAAAFASSRPITGIIKKNPGNKVEASHTLLVREADGTKKHYNVDEAALPNGFRRANNRVFDFDADGDNAVNIREPTKFEGVVRYVASPTSGVVEVDGEMLPYLVVPNRLSGHVGQGGQVNLVKVQQCGITEAVITTPVRKELTGLVIFVHNERRFAKISVMKSDGESVEYFASFMEKIGRAPFRQGQMVTFDLGPEPRPQEGREPRQVAKSVTVVKDPTGEKRPARGDDKRKQRKSSDDEGDDDFFSGDDNIFKM